MNNFNGKKNEINFNSWIYKLTLFQLCVISISIAIASLTLGLSIILLVVLFAKERRWILPSTPLDYFFAAYIVIEFITTATALNLSGAFHNTKRLLLLLIVYMTMLSFTSKEKIRQSLKILSVTIALLSVVEIFLYFYEHNDRLFVFQHYMTTGGLKMIVCLLLIPFVFDEQTTNKEKLFYVATLIPTLIALILTNTRSAWMGFVAGVFVLSALYYRKLLYIFGIFIVLFFLLAPQRQIDRAKSIIDLNDPTNKGRLMMWETGLKIFVDHPLLGVGDSDLADIYARYKSPEDHEPAGHLHNNFMTLLVTIGSIGLTIVCMLFAKILHTEYTIFKKWKHVPFVRNISLGAFAVFTGFLINGMFEWNFGDHEIMVFVWFTVGLTLAAERLMHREIA